MIQLFPKSYKRQRFLRLSVKHTALVIGDPIDKPHPEFFDKLENELVKLGLNTQNTIFIGDSPRNDLAIPLGRGYKAYYINRKK